MGSGDRLSKVQFTTAHFQESFVMLWIDTNGQFALFSSEACLNDYGIRLAYNIILIP